MVSINSNSTEHAEYGLYDTATVLQSRFNYSSANFNDSEYQQPMEAHVFLDDDFTQESIKSARDAVRRQILIAVYPGLAELGLPENQTEHLDAMYGYLTNAFAVNIMGDIYNAIAKVYAALVEW